VSATLVITVRPDEAAAMAEIHVDGELVIGKRIELPSPRRVHVSVTALGYRRETKHVDVKPFTEIEIELRPMPHGKKSRTLPVTIGMGVLSAAAWFLRRR
jgi:hypothetical protein